MSNNDDKNIKEDTEFTEPDIEIEKDENLDDSVIAEESQIDTIKKLREKVKILSKEKQDILGSWQRDKADFINARKRDKEDIENIKKFASENLISDLIIVLESFEMAFANKEAWEKADKNWRVGVEYIYNQFKKILSDHGLSEISPLNEKFDPWRDEASEHILVDDKSKDNIILEIVQKGYALNGKILRPPKVKVGEYKESK